MLCSEWMHDGFLYTLNAITEVYAVLLDTRTIHGKVSGLEGKTVFIGENEWRGGFLWVMGVQLVQAHQASAPLEELIAVSVFVLPKL